MVSVADLNAFVGLDYHSCFVQVCVLDGAGKVLLNRRLENHSSRIVNEVNRVCAGRPVKGVAVEACCGSSQFAEELSRFGWEVSLAHAGVCSKMKQNPDKSDFSDAHLLADLCRVGYLPRVWLAPSKIRDLRRLGRFRQQLVNQRRNCKLRIRAILREERIVSPSTAGTPWTLKWMQWLKATKKLPEHGRWIMDQHLNDLQRLVRDIRGVEKRMEEATADDPVVQKLREIKGVGIVTAVVLRAEVGSFDRFQSGKQLARYCALSPRNASSGNRQADSGLIRAGCLPLRTLIIETAHRLTRYDEHWKAMKEALRKRGKHGSVATAAVANRWIRRLFWEMKPISQQQVA